MPCNKKTKELLFTETSSPFLFSLILLLCSFDNLLQRFCDRCFQLRLICRCLDGQLTDQCCYVIVSNLTKAWGGTVTEIPADLAQWSPKASDVK